MTPSPIAAGTVDWSGDNPGIYLKASEDGPYTALSLWFRIAVSAFGAGHVAVVLAEPGRAGGWPACSNFCVADNLPLARDLLARFVPRFGVFQGIPALAGLPLIPMSEHHASGDNLHTSRVLLRGEGIEVDLVWNQLGTPFCADLAPEVSATGEHRMLSVFVESGDAAVIVNGRRLPGRPFPRPFLGRTMSSAFLASSETWLKV